MKVINLRPNIKPQYEGRELYTFNLSVGGFIINGFTYSRKGGAILSPTLPSKKRIVRAFGIQWKRLRELIEEELRTKQSEGERVESTEYRDRSRE